MLDGRTDLAFAALLGPYPSGLTVRPLASEQLLLACPQDHPLTRFERVPLAELDGAKFVDFPPGWGVRASVDRLFEQTGLTREVAVEVSDVPTAIELVLAGFGCAFLSESLTVAGRPVPLRPVEPTPSWEISLVTPSTRRISAAAQALVELLLESASAGRRKAL